MKIGLVLFMLIPLAGCAYVGWHVWRILPLSVIWKWMVVLVLLLCFCQLFLNFVIGLDNLPLPVARILYAIGTSSIIVLLYLFMLFAILDVAHLFRLIPESFLHNSMVGSLTVSAIMLTVFVYGNIQYYNKVRVHINIDTDKVDKPVRLIMMSDLHLGYHNTRNDLATWVDMLNKENADAILIAGDIVDISVEPLLKENMAAEFRRLNAPVYACLGNHDYYAGEPRSEQFYRESGIKLLRDSSAVLNGEIVVIGRDDRTNSRRSDVGRLVKNFTGKNKNAFTILLDHQPYHLEEAELAGIDFQFSGHTHYGQVWPISWVEDLMYECAFGEYRRGQTRYYVSSGIGIWGGKFRIGTRSEYIVATIK